MLFPLRLLKAIATFGGTAVLFVPIGLTDHGDVVGEIAKFAARAGNTILPVGSPERGIAPCVSGNYVVSVTPDDSTVTWPQFTNGHTARFTVTNLSSDCTESYNFTHTESGPISGVTLDRSSSGLGPGVSVTVTATFNVGAAGGATLTVKATGAFAGDWNTGEYVITVQPPPPPPQIAVTPDAGTTSAPLFSQNNSVSFTVAETGGGTGDNVSFSCTPSGAVTSCVPPASVPLGPGGSAPVSVSYNVGAPGSGTLILHGQGSSSSDDGQFTVTVTDPIAPTARLMLPTGDVYVQSPTIKIGWCDNNSLNAATRWIKVNGVDLTSSFDYVAGSEPTDCTARATSTTASVPLNIGSNTVQAYICDNSGTCTSPAPSFNITRRVANAPIATLVNHNRDNIDRSLCLTAAAGDAAEVQCGDLVAYHAMPAFRSMGRDRSLTLVYNSASAEPRPRVAVQATLPSGEQPQNVYAELTVSGAPRASATFSSWAPGATRQFVLAFDASGFTTGLYPFTLLVRSTFPGAVYDAVVNDTLIIVNREGSEFGAGWYLSGVEQLLLSQPGGSILWVGGDGSAKVYRSIGGGQWQAPAGSFRDVIVQVGATYERRSKHGVTVTFDGMGHHISTRNRLGHVTTFTWDGNGKLTQVKVPGPGGD